MITEEIKKFIKSNLNVSFSELKKAYPNEANVIWREAEKNYHRLYKNLKVDDPYLSEYSTSYGLTTKLKLKAVEKRG